MITEIKLTTGLVGTLRRVPNAVAIKHNDAKTAGIPDITFTWLGTTTWLEAKLVINNKIIERHIQRWIMEQLARQGSAYYVYYTIDREGNYWTEIWAFMPINNVYCWILQRRTDGHNHLYVLDYVRDRHIQRATHVPVQ